MNAFLRAISYPFMLLAATGFILSLLAHLMALFNVPIPWHDSAWLLHMGIFVVWLPAVLTAQRIAKNSSNKNFWKAAMLGCPPWMRTAGVALFVYAILNFVYFAFTHGKGGQSDGGIPIRGFSGHWLIFYGAAFAILYSVRQRPELLDGVKCPNGHEVDPLAKFCGSCGAQIPEGKDG